MVKFISSGIAALSYLKGHYNADRPGRVSDWNDTANVDGNGNGNAHTSSHSGTEVVEMEGNEIFKKHPLHRKNKNKSTTLTNRRNMHILHFK